MGLEGGNCEIETRRVRQSHKADLRFLPDIVLLFEHRLISNWEICSVIFVELAYVLKLLISELDIYRKKYILFDNDSLAQTFDFSNYKFKRKQRE